MPKISKGELKTVAEWLKVYGLNPLAFPNLALGSIDSVIQESLVTTALPPMFTGVSFGHNKDELNEPIQVFTDLGTRMGSREINLLDNHMVIPLDGVTPRLNDLLMVEEHVKVGEKLWKTMPVVKQLQPILGTDFRKAEWVIVDIPVPPLNLSGEG